MSENVKEKLLIEPHYLPCFSWMKLAGDYKSIYFSNNENYVKASYRNRCHVLSPNGILTMSIPVKKSKEERNKMGTIKISYDFDWQKNHWMTLMSSYRRSPYFEFFEDNFAPFYQKKYELLIEMNYELIKLLFKITNIHCEIIFTDDYIEPGTEGFDDYRNMIIPTTKSLKFNQPNYIQVFSDRFNFFEDLSIADMIFNKGKINFNAI